MFIFKNYSPMKRRRKVWVKWKRSKQYSTKKEKWMTVLILVGVKKKNPEQLELFVNVVLFLHSLLGRIKSLYNSFFLNTDVARSQPFIIL